MTSSTTEIGEQSHPCSENVLESSSRLELSSFVSNTRERSASFPQGCFSKNLNHIIAVLRELLLDVNIETLYELSIFCAKENSLLDRVIATGLVAQELQQ